MKRMKKLISIRSIPVLALALLIVLGTALEAVPPAKVSGSGEWSAISPYNWVGNPVHTSLTIGSETFENVQYTVLLSELSGPNDEGVYQGTTTEQLFVKTLPDETLVLRIRTVNDKVTLEPTEVTGEYTLKVRSTIASMSSVNGIPITGGRLRIQGTVYNWPSQSAYAYFTVQGSISY